MTTYISLDNLTLYDTLIKQYIAQSGGGGTSITNLYFGECTDVASTTVKNVVCSNFTLQAGCLLLVHFTNTNYKVGLSLNVNNTGNIPIYVFNQQTASTFAVQWRKDEIVMFQYDGTKWNILNKDVILFNDSTGVGSGNINFTKSLAEFSYIDIIFTDGVREYSQRVYAPSSGKYTSLFRIFNGAATSQYIESLMVSFASNTRITLSSGCQSTLTTRVTTASSQLIKIIEIRGR